MSLAEVVEVLRTSFDDLNPPANERELAQLRNFAGAYADELVSVYTQFNGSSVLPMRDERCLAVRLMRIDELLRTQDMLEHAFDELATLGSVRWFGTDDNSNYCGLYIDGPASGWWTRLNHDEPMLTPAYRSLSNLLSNAATIALKTDAAADGVCDLVGIPTDAPVVAPHDSHVTGDRHLARTFRELYLADDDLDQRRLYAYSTICLTPVEDTQEVLSFLDDGDMWTPEAAIRLLELRGCPDGINLVEKLARDGKPNGDSAAMRHLVRLNTDVSRRAVARLKESLVGPKRQMLEMWDERRDKLLPPTWP